MRYLGDNLRFPHAPGPHGVYGPGIPGPVTREHIRRDYMSGTATNGNLTLSAGFVGGANNGGIASLTHGSGSYLTAADGKHYTTCHPTSYSSGKRYLEFVAACEAISTYWNFGIGDATALPAAAAGAYIGTFANSAGCSADGTTLRTATGFTIATPGTGLSPLTRCIVVRYRIAVDVDNKKAWLGAVDNWFMGDPSSGRNPMITWSGSYTIRAMFCFIADAASAAATPQFVATCERVSHLPRGYSAW